MLSGPIKAAFVELFQLNYAGEVPLSLHYLTFTIHQSECTW